MLTFNQILADLKNQKYHPIYFLYGEEAFFIDVISDYIENKVLDESQKEFDQTVVYGKDADIPTIISHAKRFPMLGEKHVVIVKEAQAIKKLDELVAYVKQPLNSTILVFCYKYSKLDKRTLLAKSLNKDSVVFESKKLYENKISEWITQQLKLRGYGIQFKAASLMTEFLGTDLSKITNEIEKLCINLPKGTEISPEHVEDNIGISKDFNVFELQKALAKKDILHANQIINYFAANQKDNPLVKVAAMLYGFFVKILIYHHHSGSGDDVLCKALGVQKFFLSDYRIAARNYKRNKLMRIMSSLREYDLKAKGVNNVTAKDGELMKELIFKILH